MKYTYIVSFWNQETDEELFGRIDAESWFEADRIARQYNIDGFSRGIVFYSEPKEGYVEISKPIAEIATLDKTE